MGFDVFLEVIPSGRSITPCLECYRRSHAAQSGELPDPVSNYSHIPSGEVAVMGKAEYKKAKAIAAESPKLLGKWIDVSLNDSDSPFGSTYQLEKSALKDLYRWKKSGDMAHAHRLMSDILRNLQELS